MKARNVVLAGDYKGGVIGADKNGRIEPLLTPGIFKRGIPLSKETVESMEVINQATIQSAAYGFRSIHGGNKDERRKEFFSGNR